MRRLAWACALVMFVLLLAPAAHAGEAVLPSGDRLYWDDGLSDAARRVRVALPRIRTRVADVLGLAVPSRPAHVHLVSGWSRIKEIAGNVPEWAAGVCVGHKGLVVIRTDAAERSASQTLENVLRHEWVHFAWSSAAGSRTRQLPLWVEEGLAERVGGGFSVEGGQHLDLAASLNRLLVFDEIATAWPKSDTTAALAYLQSRSWVDYFIATAGGDVLRSVLRDVRDGTTDPTNGGPFESAVFQHTKRPVSYWIEDWRLKAKARAGSWFTNLFTDVSTTLFLIIAIVGGISYFFIRVKRRRAIAAMPDGDFPPGAEQR